MNFRGCQVIFSMDTQKERERGVIGLTTALLLAILLYGIGIPFPYTEESQWGGMPSSQGLGTTSS